MWKVERGPIDPPPPPMLRVTIFSRRLLGLKVNTHFIKFDTKNLFDYILSLNDCSIFDLTVFFIKDIMENYISAISKLQN